MAVPRVLVLPRFEIHLAGPPQLDVPGKGFELEPGGVAAAAEGEGEAMFAGAHRVHGKAGIEVAVEGGDRSREAGAWRDHDRDVAVMCPQAVAATRLNRADIEEDRKSTRLNSSHGYISYAVFCLKKKKSMRTASTHWCSIT